MLEELKISFKEYLQEKNITTTTITKRIIDDYITYIYYDLYDNLDNIEEIEEAENNIGEQLEKIFLK